MEKIVKFHDSRKEIMEKAEEELDKAIKRHSLREANLGPLPEERLDILRQIEEYSCLGDEVYGTDDSMLEDIELSPVPEHLAAIISNAPDLPLAGIAYYIPYMLNALNALETDNNDNAQYEEFALLYENFFTCIMTYRDKCEEKGLYKPNNEEQLSNDGLELNELIAAAKCRLEFAQKNVPPVTEEQTKEVLAQLDSLLYIYISMSHIEYDENRH